jgi:hypothetical protein
MRVALASALVIAGVVLVGHLTFPEGRAEHLPTPPSPGPVVETGR